MSTPSKRKKVKFRENETKYLLQNPVMAKRLLNAVSEVKKGIVLERPPHPLT